MIINYMMMRLVRKMAELEKWSHEIGPKVFSGNFTYQVRAHGEEQFVVDINDRTCGCNMWQLIRIPCVHGIAAVLSTNHNPMDFIHLRRGGGTDSVATTEGGSQSIGGSQADGRSQAEHQDGQPRGGKRTKSKKYMGCCFSSSIWFAFVFDTSMLL
ncbi:hypothetical protein Q3G72_020985 [Acer saccharum]|nr:hypothetical protein Q3G72_020985 [Acer saccharum]